MKLRVFEEKERKEEMYLRLEQEGERILLYTVDINGIRHPSGNLLFINSNGTIHRIARVDPSLGFDLKEDGRIKLSGEKEDEKTN